MPLPEYVGPIRHVVLHAADGLVERQAGPAVELIRAMSPDTRITVACNGDTAQGEFRARLDAAGIAPDERIQFVDIPGPLSIWARDRYIATRPRRATGRSTWIVPRMPLAIHEPMRANEQAVPALLAMRSGDIAVLQSTIQLEGGNLIAMEDRILIGANVLTENLQEATPKRTRANLGELFALPIDYVMDDSGSPPMPHLDMYVTALGPMHVLVADPRLGAAILDTADDATRAAVAERLLGAPDVSAARADRFDAVARRLESDGYRITRIPFLDNRGGDFAITYNNVLQESRADRHIVYLPTYRVPALDAAARQVYESLGCEVRPIDVSLVSHLLGAVRCLANVVERGNVKARS
jgi:hypothetical protein